MITVIIIVHNVASRSEILSMTDTCFQTLSLNTLEEHELLLIDNGSQDDGKTMELLRKHSSSVIRHENNESISKCWNEAIDAAQYGTIVLVNNDVVFNRLHWLSALISPLARDGVGVVGSRMVQWNGFEFLEGAFLAFKRETARSIAENGKIFDERFIFTCEDADFCRRMVTFGRHLCVVPIEEMGYVTHLKHGSLCWSDADGGWNGESILNVMHDGRVQLCRKYGCLERVDD